MRNIIFRSRRLLVPNTITKSDVQNALGCSDAENKILVEVDGPVHFLHGTNKYTIATKVKHRALASLGYRVIHIPYFEWNKLHSIKGKQNYLIQKFNEPFQLELEDSDFTEITGQGSTSFVDGPAIKGIGWSSIKPWDWENKK